MNAASSRRRTTGVISNDMRAIWAGVLLIGYLVWTGILLTVGARRARPADLLVHSALLLAVAAATWIRATPRWLRLWTPLLALLFLYSELPGLIRAVGHVGFFDERVLGWEAALFGGQPARDWAAATPSLALSEMLHLAYLSYYPIIFVVPGILYITERFEDFREAVFVLMLTFVGCFAMYVCFPVIGPRYLWPSPLDAAGGIVREATRWLLDARSSAGTAFPSSHVAVAVTQSLLAVRYFGRKGLVVAILTALLSAGAIYGGYHYAIDVLAGLLVGGIFTGIGLLMARWLRARESAQANATAPT
jgi:membrane-associated phospholipid phosphatase